MPQALALPLLLHRTSSTSIVYSLYLAVEFHGVPAGVSTSRAGARPADLGADSVDTCGPAVGHPPAGGSRPNASHRRQLGVTPTGLLRGARLVFASLDQARSTPRSGSLIRSASLRPSAFALECVPRFARYYSAPRCARRSAEGLSLTGSPLPLRSGHRGFLARGYAPSPKNRVALAPLGYIYISHKPCSLCNVFAAKVYEHQLKSLERLDKCQQLAHFVSGECFVFSSIFTSLPQGCWRMGITSWDETAKQRG